jgi:hypothetical protein
LPCMAPVSHHALANASTLGRINQQSPSSKSKPTARSSESRLVLTKVLVSQTTNPPTNNTPEQ